MSFWDKISRVFEALDNKGIYGACAYGLNGTLTGKSVISESTQFVFFDPVVPNKNKFPISIPAIIWFKGSLFCLDFKRWKGTVEYEVITETVKVKKKFLFIPYKIKEKIKVGENRNKVVKRKVGNYGEAEFVKEFKNPTKKVLSYIYVLKKYLKEINNKWDRLLVHPVVVFIGDDINLEGIHSFTDGIVYLSEIQKFLESKVDNNIDKSPSDWILQGLNSLTTWDRIITRDNIPFQGIILDEIIYFDDNGVKKSVSLKNVNYIEINRNGILSEYDSLIIHMDNNSTFRGRSKRQSINLNFNNKLITHKIRNISRIDIGISKVKDKFSI